MGYDHECIVNIQSLPGEYFCPVCRTLVYPSEALQSQCTHLYCKPCLAYIVATTHACPYDGYLVTEADSKPLTESGKELAETIGKVTVFCLYQRSGCQWQGALAESNAHCAGCTYGNSPVVCNRCGTQIIHRQVQEHAQICPGIQPQAQAVENAQAQASAAGNQAAALDSSSATAASTAAATTAAPQTNAAITAPSATVASGAAAVLAVGQPQVQGSAVAYPQAAAQAPTPEQQWYQQQQLQYQQYYQQYPGYDPYQQQYYAQYQQHAYPQYQQPQMQAAPQHAIPGQPQPQPYMQPQAQPQSQPHLQPQPQPQLQQQPQPQVVPQGQHQPQPLAQAQPQAQHQPHPQLHLQPQIQPQLQLQPQVQAAQSHIHPSQPQVQAQQPQVPPQQPHLHAQMQAHPPPHGPVAGQPYTQSQPHAAQARPPHPPGPPQHPQLIPQQQLQQQIPQQQMLHPQPQPQLHAQQQPRPQQPFPHPQPQLHQTPMQMQPQPQPNMQPPNAPVPAPAVSGYQSYPQTNPVVPQQRPVHMHPQQQGMPNQLPQQTPQAPAQFPPQQPPQMRPPHSQMAMPVQQPAMPPPQGPHANLYPSQQQVHHSAHQPGQQIQHQPGMPHHGAQHGYPQPPPQGPVHPGQPQQHGSVPPQHQAHPQQSVRSQGPTYIQQTLPGPPQGLPPNQAQARPMMQQPVPQSPGAGPKVMQPGMNQQSPNQSYMGRGPQSGPVQQSQLPHSGSQGGLVPASPATPKQGTSTPDKVGQATLSEGTKSGDRISENMQDLKSTGDEGKGAADLKEKDAQIENENKDVSESVAKEQIMDELLIKKVKEEEGANRSLEAPGSSHASKVAGEEKETHGQEGKLDNRSGLMAKEEGAHRLMDRGQIGGNANNSMHPPPQMPGSGAFGRGQQQPMQDNMHAGQQRGFPQAGYNDRNPTQFPQHYTVSDDRREMPPGGPLSGQQRYPQANPQGHPPQWPDPAMAQQRPPAPDRMFPQPTAHSSQERRFPEPPHQIPMQGQAMPPNQMRPPGHASETFSHHGQEPFWPPPQAGLPGPSLPPPPPPPPGGVQAHHGFPPKGSEQHAMTPQGQPLNHMPPHAGGARTPLGEPFPRPMMDGPPPGAFDAPSRMMGGPPPFIHEDKVGQSALGNAMETDPHAIRRPGVYDGRQLDPHRPLPMEHAPYGQPSVMKLNGNNVPAGGMNDSSFAHGLAEDRFRPKPFPDEGFKTAPDEHFRPSLLDPARHIANRREFEEDLKQFPRPSYLDGEGPPRADGFLPSSRPLDRMTQPHGGFNALTSRPLPSYQSGPPFPPSIGSSEFNSNMDRERPIPFHDHMGRKHEETSAHPDRPNLVPEFARHRLDGLPPLRSPGHFGRDFPDGPPSQLRRGPDGHGPLGLGLPSDIRGNETGGPPNVPNFSRGGGGFGGFHGRPDMGEPGGPGNLPAHLRLGDPGFNGHFSSVSREGDIDPFEQSRKRKPGGMVRCLICKIDCETVEGLELHSQTRGHQKVAMDMVLSIKKDNAKKHKLTPENAAPMEGANRPRKAIFDKRGNRQ